MNNHNEVEGYFSADYVEEIDSELMLKNHQIDRLTTQLADAKNSLSDVRAQLYAAFYEIDRLKTLLKNSTMSDM